MKFFSNEVKIALMAIVGLVVLFFGLNFLKGLSLFSSNNTYYVLFNDVTGMSASSPVYVNGYKMGVVERIDYDYSRPDQIVAAVGMDKKLQVPRGSQAEITSDLLGNVKLVLKLGDASNGMLAVGDTLEGRMHEGVMSKAAEMLPQVAQLLPKMDSILASMNTLLADPAIAATLHNAEQLTAQLSSASGDLRRLSAQVGQRLPSMMGKADSMLTHTEQLTAQLAAIDFAASMRRVDDMLANVQQLSAALNDGEGTLGLLLRDEGLYRHLTSTMRDVDSLLVDFKAHPMRYINVSVFGRKAK